MPCGVRHPRVPGCLAGFCFGDDSVAVAVGLLCCHIYVILECHRDQTTGGNCGRVLSVGQVRRLCRASGPAVSGLRLMFERW